MSDIRLVGLAAAIGGGLVGGAITYFSTRRNKKEVAAATDDKELQKNETADFEIRKYVTLNAEFVKFDVNWNNGTGYFDSLETAKFVGHKKKAMLYSVCPTSGRIVVILNKAGANGRNIVFFKRYNNPLSPYWRIQGSINRYAELLKLSQLGINGENLTATTVLTILKEYVRENNDVVS